MQITDKDIQTFRERAKTELQSNGAVGRLAWDAVVNALCNEVEELRKNAAPGSAAALREAAERICSIDQSETQDLRQLAQFCHDQSIYGGGLIERVLADIEIVRQALSAPPEPPSNAAAMREALEHVEKLAREFAVGNYYVCDFPKMLLDAIRAALAARARNCDRFQTELDAQLAFLNDVWLISVEKEPMQKPDKFENWTEQMKTCYGRWLLAPAKKGGDK